MAETVMAPLALLRFSALGDVASALRIAFEARRRWPNRRIIFCAHSRFRDVIECLSVSVEFWGFGEEVRNVTSLAARLRSERAEVVDLHRSLRTTLLRAQTPHLKWHRLRKHRRRRRALVHGDPSAFSATHRVQFEQAALLGLELSAEPWLEASPGQAFDFVLVPGAAWPEKRWPLSSFAALARSLSVPSRVAILYSQHDGLPIDDQDWGDASLEGDHDLKECIELLAASGMVLSNDTGFAHIAEGLGVPVRVLIGPTDQRLGAAPQSDFATARALTLGLPCQPCSQKGDRVCHVGGRPCLVGWTPELVLAELASFAASVDGRSLPEG